MGTYRFDEAAETIYHFTWHEVCDWYLEIIKPTLFDENSPGADAARATLWVVIERLLRLLHPIMPFLTEELWQNLPGPEQDRPESIALSAYPDRKQEWEDDEAESAIKTLMEVVTVRRNLEAEVGGRAARGSRTLIVPSTGETGSHLERLKGELKSLTRSDGVEILDAFPAGLVAVRGVTSNAEVAMPLEGLDIEAERSRLRKQIDKTEKELSVHDKKLGNDNFVARAKPEAVQKVRDAHSELSDRIGRMRTTLDQLGG